MITVCAKFGKARETFTVSPTMTIYQLKCLLMGRTNVLQHRQKLLGLSLKAGGPLTDEAALADVKSKGGGKRSRDGGAPPALEFIMMGTPESDIFVDPSEMSDLPQVVDDFDLPLGAEWSRELSNRSLLQAYISSTKINIMNELRAGKPLLVLDLDHTILDFSRKAVVSGEGVEQLKRPFMDYFLRTCYEHYDLAVWSQTSWRWLEVKLVELGLCTSPHFKISFVLDKTSMFKIKTVVKGKEKEAAVKPMELIWSNLPGFDATNTVHVDDLKRNFALNPNEGIQVEGWYRNKGMAGDVVLRDLAGYLVELATKMGGKFDKVNKRRWKEGLTLHDDDDDEKQQGKK